MKKDALFHNDPFSGSEKTALFSFCISGNGRALFRQNRVAVLTKRQCTLSLMSSTSTQCERPAL